MEHEKSLQLESGNFTRIVNRIIDELVKMPLLGAELAICLFVIRKTYGFNKKEDEISLSQFQKGIGRSRPTVVKALKVLVLGKVLLLVKTNPEKGFTNKYRFNKYYKEWALVKVPKLVKEMTQTSKEKLKKVVKTPLHTKENTKEKQKTAKTPKEFLQGNQWNELIDGFREVNPMYESFYRMKTERVALQDIVNAIGFEKTKWLILRLRLVSSRPYAPKVTKPTELRRDMGKLILFWEQEKNKNIKSKGRGLIE